MISGNLSYGDKEEHEHLISISDFRRRGIVLHVSSNVQIFMNFLLTKSYNKVFIDYVSTNLQIRFLAFK